MRLLLIDDDPDLRRLLRHLLQGEGFEVIVAAGGMEGLALARRSRPDVILLDLMMPDLDGFEVAERLKADPATAAPPIVILTGKHLGAADRARLAPVAARVFEKGAVVLPELATALEALAAPPAPPAGSPARRALVVEDGPADAELAEALLGAAGWAVDQAPSLRAAEAFLAARLCDLVLLDLRLPDGDGLSLAARLAADPSRRLPVVAVTALPEAEAAPRARAAGCAAFLPKPLTPAGLAAALRIALAAA